MPKSLNRAELIGNLGKDPEMRYTPSGQAVTRFSVATNYSYTKNDGTKVDATDWHNIEAWGKLAEIINQHCQKGDKVFVSGRMKTDKYDADDGTTKYFFKVVANEIIMLGGSGNGNSASEGNEEQLPEEIPF
jgi:single-strand DNA-binding protein